MLSYNRQNLAVPLLSMASQAARRSEAIITAIKKDNKYF